MHNKNQNKKTVAFVNIEDLNRDPEGVMAAIEAYEQEHCVPEERDDRTLEEVEADLNESLIALDKHFQPMPRPTPEEIKADPENFVILDRADLEPYFPEYMPTKNIQLLILALLESFRRKNA